MFCVLGGTEEILVKFFEFSKSAKNGIFGPKIVSLEGKRFDLKRNVYKGVMVNTFEDSLGLFWIRYLHNCHMDRDPNSLFHPALEDFAALYVLQSTGVVINPIYLSPPSACVESPAVSFTGWTSSNYFECAKIGGKIRFEILEAVEIVNFFSDFSKIMRLGMLMIEGLEKIHALGLVHGDIDMKAVGFRKSDGSFVFLNFWKAEYFSKNTNIPDITEASSPWAFNREPAGPRDDIYRTLETIANIISKGKIEKFAKKNSPEFLFNYKTSGQLFDKDLSVGDDVYYTNMYEQYASLNPKKQAKTQKILNEITQTVLQLQFGEIPNYQAIINAFRELA